MSSKPDTIVIGTVYHRNGEAYISEEGKERKVLDSVDPWTGKLTSVVKLGDYDVECVFQPIHEPYNGPNHLQRTSNTISRIVSEVGVIEKNVADDQLQTPTDVANEVLRLLPKVADLLHDDVQYFHAIHHRLRTAVISASKKFEAQCVITSQERALSCHLMGPNRNRIPALHFACLHGFSTVTISGIHDSLGRDAFVAQGRELAPIDTATIPSKFSVELSRFSASWSLSPAHIAALSGNIDLLVYFFQCDPYLAQLETNEPKFKLCELAAFASIECFEFVQNYVPKWDMNDSSSSEREATIGRTTLMALLGKRSDIILSLPKPLTTSLEDMKKALVSDYAKEMVLLAAQQGHADTINWFYSNRHILAQEAIFTCDVPLFSNTIPSGSDIASGTSFWEWLGWSKTAFAIHSVSHLHVSKWILDITDSSDQTDAVNWNAVAHQAARIASLTVDGFQWFLSISSFNPETTATDGSTLAHSACWSDSSGVLDELRRWENTKNASMVPAPEGGSVTSLFSVLDNQKYHIAHTSAQHGSVGCLKWISKVLFKNEGFSVEWLMPHPELGPLAHIAVANHQLKVLKWLKKRHPEYFATPNNSRLHPLQFAAQCGFLYILDWMESRLGKRCLETHQPLFQAKSIETLIWFQSHSVPPNALDPQGRTVAHYIAETAITLHDLKPLKWLVQNRALDLKEIDQNKSTVLHILARRSVSQDVGFLEWVRPLNLDWKAIDRFGHSVAFCAAARGNTSLLDHLVGENIISTEEIRSLSSNPNFDLLSKKTKEWFYGKFGAIPPNQHP